MNYKYKFRISNLDCANCAKRIEDALNKNDKITKSVVNFVKLEITIETPLKNNVYKLVKDIVKKIEPDVKIFEENKNKNISIKYDIIRLFVGIILFLISFIIKNNIIHEICLLFVYYFYIVY